LIGGASKHSKKFFRKSTESNGMEISEDVSDMQFNCRKANGLLINKFEELRSNKN
jgi:hypothetical protein